MSCEDLLFSDMIELEVVVVVVKLGRIDVLVEEELVLILH